MNVQNISEHVFDDHYISKALKIVMYISTIISRCHLGNKKALIMQITT